MSDTRSTCAQGWRGALATPLGKPPVLAAVVRAGRFSHARPFPALLLLPHCDSDGARPGAGGPRRRAYAAFARGPAEWRSCWSSQAVTYRLNGCAIALRAGSDNER